MTDLPFLGQIAGQGILGIITALSLFANWYFIKTIQTLNDRRVQDAQDITNKLLEPISMIKQNSELLITLFNKFLNTTMK